MKKQITLAVIAILFLGFTQVHASEMTVSEDSDLTTTKLDADQAGGPIDDMVGHATENDFLSIDEKANRIQAMIDKLNNEMDTLGNLQNEDAGSNCLTQFGQTITVASDQLIDLKANPSHEAANNILKNLSAVLKKADSMIKKGVCTNLTE